jgi:hypothetical protein
LTRFFLTAIALLALTSCDYQKVEREIGYKGKARVNPWLAAERFAQRTGHEVLPAATWTTPEWQDATWLVPAEILGNESFTRRMETWTRGGGHLILLVDHAAATASDWSHYIPPPQIQPPLKAMLRRAGIRLHEQAQVSTKRITFHDGIYQVDARSAHAVSLKGGRKRVFASVPWDDGRLTVVSDARIFRNRWIDQHDHAALLKALLDASPRDGRVGLMRGSGLSFWKLLGEHLAPVLTVLGTLIFLWLWKNLPRFGPLEAEEGEPELRGYGHHLEALGHFHWKLDHAAALLADLRARVAEAAQRACHNSGHGHDMHDFLASRCGLPVARVARILTETSPQDAAALTRTTADLQQMLEMLEPHSDS